jgi:hypothetical protein
MARDMAVADALAQHVLGPGDPSGQLIEEGKFPPGWAEEYRRLLRLAELEWLGEPLWPRSLVAAMHYTLIYLDVRYSAWRSHGGGGHRNEVTERDLARVTGPTRLFFARAFSLVEQGPRPAGEGAESLRDG